MEINDRRLIEVIGFYHLRGKDETLHAYDIKEDTLRRYISEARKRGIELDKSKALSDIARQYSPKELQAIARGGRVAPGQPRVPIVSFEGQRIRIGMISDTHYGSIYTNPDITFKFFDECVKENVEFITHSGDVTEGMSTRPGHVYELSHIGYTAQKDEAVRIWKDCPKPFYMIDGNHDRWYVQNSGAYIVENICNEIEHGTYLGQDEGDISLKGYSVFKLWHGIDGNSYALSYRLQKLVEALTGGEKPGAIAAGHVHKSLYIFERFIHCWGVGTGQHQTKWMRGKRIAAHLGFWIIDLWVNKNGITKARGTWYPFYA